MTNRSADDSRSHQNLESAEKRLNGYIVEYNALRDEIRWLVEGATQYQNVAIALIGGLAVVLGWVVEKTPFLTVPSLLLIPFLFSLLGFLYFRQHEEVFIIAAYISEYVRPRIRAIVQDSEMWGWEEFKTKRNQEVSKALFRILSTTKMIFLLRTSLFILPGLLSLMTIVSYVADKGLFKFFESYTILSDIAMSVAFVIDCVIVVVLIDYLLVRGDLSKQFLRSNLYISDL